jgi:hypothetical protein
MTGEMLPGREAGFHLKAPLLRKPTSQTTLEANLEDLESGPVQSGF